MEEREDSGGGGWEGEAQCNQANRNTDTTTPSRCLWGNSFVLKGRTCSRSPSMSVRHSPRAKTLGFLFFFFIFSSRCDRNAKQTNLNSHQNRITISSPFEGTGTGTDPTARPGPVPCHERRDPADAPAPGRAAKEKESNLGAVPLWGRRVFRPEERPTPAAGGAAFPAGGGGKKEEEEEVVVVEGGGGRWRSERTGGTGRTGRAAAGRRARVAGRL